MTRKTLIFSHIPKAAGMTTRQIVARQFVGQKMMLDHGDAFEIEELLALPQEDRDAIRCINGHVAFGVHRYLTQPCEYITFLRDPAERLLSAFFFWRVNKTDPVEEVFERFAQRSRRQSVQIDYLVGYDTEPDAESGRIDFGRNHLLPLDEKLGLAEAHIRDHYAFVGLVEHFDESLMLLRQKMGWSNVYYIHKHYNQARPRGNETSPKLREIAEHYTQQDRAAYEMVKKIYEAQRQAYRDDLAEDVRVFRRNNRLYNRVFGATRFVHESMVYKKFRLMMARKG